MSSLLDLIATGNLSSYFCTEFCVLFYLLTSRLRSLQAILAFKGDSPSSYQEIRMRNPATSLYFS